MNLFLDTNAVVKLYHEELGTDYLTHFLLNNSEDLIVSISDLTKIEFHSTFMKYVRSRKIGISVIREIFSIFREDLRMMNIIEINTSIKSLAIELLDSIGCEKSLRTLDALQLSAALVTHQIIPVDYFVCSDKKLVNVAKQYFPVLNPENQNT